MLKDLFVARRCGEAGNVGSKVRHEPPGGKDSVGGEGKTNTEATGFRAEGLMALYIEPVERGTTM